MEADALGRQGRAVLRSEGIVCVFVCVSVCLYVYFMIAKL